MTNILLSLLLFVSFNVQAILKIEITQGVEGAIPIAIKKFIHEGTTSSPVSISELISSNLSRSGIFSPSDKKLLAILPAQSSEFKLLKNNGVDFFVIGKTKEVGQGSYVVQFELFDILKKSRLMGYSFQADTEQLRAIGHKISDLIFKEITGEKGAFSTKIAYISSRSENGTSEYFLNIADSDGYNSKAILTSSQPLMSPNWSPDAKELAYVSFEQRRSTIYVQNINTGVRKKIVSFDGINGAPAFSPDGKKMALTMSFEGNAEIYIIDLFTGKRHRFTKNSAIDTEPSWLPASDGIVFTSDRSGSPQLYLKKITEKRAKRLSFEGNYNASPSVSNDGKSIALVQGNSGNYQIAILDIKTRALRIISQGKLDESPSFAPNDSMILFASKKQDKGVFGAVSFDGRMKQVFSLNDTGIREPVWSPFLD